MHPLYVLTPMTGREAAEQRTVVIGTVELNWRLWTILIAASPVAVLVTAMFWIVLGQLALILLPTVLLVAVFLFYRRSTNGLQLRTYQSIWDRRRAKSVDTFFLCGQPINTRDTHVRQLLTTAVPYGETVAARQNEAPLAESTKPPKQPRQARTSKRPAAEAPPLAPVADTAPAPAPVAAPPHQPPAQGTAVPAAAAGTDVSSLFI